MSRGDASSMWNAALSGRFRMGVVAAMRQRMDWLLPVALFALLLQLAAPVGASWFTAAAFADPVPLAQICHGTADGAPAPADQGGDQHGCGLDCPICCVLHAVDALDSPRTPALVPPQRRTTPVVWRGGAFDLVRSRAGTNAQARAPPIPS
jgi:Protein of unknown function (DUF2946)